jgi:hypothetical protein
MLSGEPVRRLLLIGILTLVLALAGGIFFTTRETRKRGEKIWDHRVKRLLVNLAIPLVTGGIVCLMLLFRGQGGLVAPLTLVFYGLALVHASKYTLGEIRSLGLLEIVLGLIALQFPGYGLWFWAIGFGLLHIVYGIYIPLKERS